MTMTRQEEITLARLVDMQLKVDGLERATLKRLSKYYKAAVKGLLSDVKKARGKSARLWTNTRLIALLEETQLQHQAIVNTMTGMTAQSSVTAGAFSYDQMNNLISWDGAVKNFNQVSLTTAQMTQLVTSQKLGGKLLGDWIGDALKPNLFPIVDDIKQGVIKGQSYEKIVRALTAELDFTPGGKKARDMETIVKTYIQAMNVNAMDDVYEANKDIVKRVEWSAIMEGGNTKTGRGTCPRCMGLDGQQWVTGDPRRPTIPLHARCRCVWYPITLTWDELGLDGGEMIDVNQPWVIRDLERKDRKILAYGTTDENYAGFWKKQDRAFQNNAIGPVRAGMVREGLIDFQDIVDRRTGDLINIVDLPGYVPPKKVKPPKPKKKPVKAKKAAKKPAKKKVAPAAAPKPQKLGIPDITYTAARTLDGVIKPKVMNTPPGVRLDGLNAKGKQSLLDGFNQSIVKYDGHLNAIEWNPRRAKSLALAARSGEYIRFQKTATKKAASSVPRVSHYAANREYRMDQARKSIADPKRASIKAYNEQKLADLEAATRWGIFDESDDPLKAVALHEGFHNVMFKHRIENAWSDGLRRNSVTGAQRLNVSEYGASSSVELFAEVGTAIEMGIEIPENIHKAFLEVMNVVLGFSKQGI